MMRKQVKRALCALLVFGLTLLSACGGTERVDSQPINIGIHDDINTLDAAGTKDMLSENVSRCIFSTLFTYDSELNVVPLLAEGYEMESDTQWVFNIRKGVKFHDGSLLTAADVKYSIDRARNHQVKDNALDVITQVEVLDDTTVQVTTKGANVDLTSIFVRNSTSIMSEKAMEDPGYDVNKPVGSGPFQFLEHKDGELIRLERFDDYFMEPAKTQYLNFVVDTSEPNRTAALLNGTLDVVFRVSTYDYDTLKLNENVKVYEKDSSKMEFLVLNPAHPPLDNLLVRQAINHAINKQALVEKVLDGHGIPLNSTLPNTIMGWVECPGKEYDPELARQLLQKAGLGQAFEVSLINYDGLRKTQLEYIKLDLAQVGITLNYEIMDINSYVQALEANENQVSVMNWTCNADPDSVFSQLFSSAAPSTLNHGRFSETQVEELLVQGRSELNLDKKQQIYETANRIVADTALFVPLYQPTVLVAASKDIGGVQLSPQGLFGYETLYRIED